MPSSCGRSLEAAARGGDRRAQRARVVVRLDELDDTQRGVTEMLGQRAGAGVRVAPLAGVDDAAVLGQSRGPRTLRSRRVRAPVALGMLAQLREPFDDPGAGVV